MGMVIMVGRENSGEERGWDNNKGVRGREGEREEGRRGRRKEEGGVYIRSGRRSRGERIEFVIGIRGRMGIRIINISRIIIIMIGMGMKLNMRTRGTRKGRRGLHSNCIFRTTPRRSRRG